MWGIANFVNVAGVEQSNNVKELHHWRAHERGLPSLDWIERKSLLLSASLDTQAPSLNPTPPFQNSSRSIQAGVIRCIQTAPCGPAVLGTSGLEGPGRLRP